MQIIGSEEYLNLLDGIALLLIEALWSDVAAVCMTRQQVNGERIITFGFAMNEGCKSVDEEFAKLLIDQLGEHSSHNTITLE